MNRPFFMFLLGIRRDEVEEAVSRVNQAFDIADKNVSKNRKNPKLASVYLLVRLKDPEEADE